MHPSESQARLAAALLLCPGPFAGQPCGLPGTVTVCDHTSSASRSLCRDENSRLLSVPRTARSVRVPLIMRSGTGARKGDTSPRTIGDRSSSRQRRYHRYSHKPPRVMSIRAAYGQRRPDHDGTRLAGNHACAGVDQIKATPPMAARAGQSSPDGIDSTATTAAGMTTRLVNGTATRLVARAYVAMRPK